MKFPQHIVRTNLRPDFLLVAQITIIMELTVPQEDCLREANERQRAKYEDLVIVCRAQGWKSRCMVPIDVGSRGVVEPEEPWASQ